MTGFGAYWRCTPCGHSWLVPRSATAPELALPFDKVVVSHDA